MGVNDAAFVCCNGKVMLTMAQRDQQHVACADRPRGVLKARPGSKVQPVIHSQIAQAIPDWCLGVRPCRRHCGHNNPYAIQPGRGITAMQAEPAPNQINRRIRQGNMAHGWP